MKMLMYEGATRRWFFSSLGPMKPQFIKEEMQHTDRVGTEGWT